MPVRVPLAVTTLVIAAAGVLLTGCGTQSGPVASDSDTATTSSPTRSDKPSTPSPTGSEPVPPFPTAPLPPEPDTEPAPFRQAWERWRTAGVSSYVLVYRIRCACPDDGSVSVRARDRRSSRPAGPRAR